LREHVRRTLEPGGVEVLEAQDGIEGLERIRSMGAGVIVCDVNMPRMDGLEMLDVMKAEGLDNPVLMLTTEGDPELIERAKNAGAKGWVTKPFNPEHLLAAVQRLHERFVAASPANRVAAS